MEDGNILLLIAITAVCEVLCCFCFFVCSYIFRFCGNFDLPCCIKLHHLQEQHYPVLPVPVMFSVQFSSLTNWVNRGA